MQKFGNLSVQSMMTNFNRTKISLCCCSICMPWISPVLVSPYPACFPILPCSKTPDSKDQDQYQACAKLADELRIWIRYVEIGSKPKTGCIGTHKDLETHALFHVSTLLWVKCIRECGEGVGQIWKLLGVQSLEDTFDTHIYFHRLVIQSKKMYVLLTSNFSSPP